MNAWSGGALRSWRAHGEMLACCARMRACGSLGGADGSAGGGRGGAFEGAFEGALDADRGAADAGRAEPRATGDGAGGGIALRPSRRMASTENITDSTFSMGGGALFVTVVVAGGAGGTLAGRAATLAGGATFAGGATLEGGGTLAVGRAFTGKGGGAFAAKVGALRLSVEGSSPNESRVSRPSRFAIALDAASSSC